VRDLDLKKKTRRLIYMGVGVFHETFNFEHTYVTCKFVGVLVGFFLQSPPFYESSPSTLLLGLFVVQKKLQFFSFFFR
jgi:hypothetical protein